MKLFYQTKIFFKSWPYFFISDVPFIWSIRRLVGFIIPFIGPFVGLKIPFIECTESSLSKFAQIEFTANTSKKPLTRPPAPNLKMKGFTLTELAITVSIGAILTAFAVPSFRDYIQNTRLVTETNEVLAALNLARTEAITRNTSVRVCAGSETGCSGVWKDGWIMFEDCNGDGIYDKAAADTTCTNNGVAAAETLIRVGQKLSDKGIKGNITDASDDKYMAFLSTGQFHDNAGNSIDICLDGMDVGRQISISSLGQTTVAFKGNC
ncbi:GspH/FimT family pseudopilin [Pseudomonadota bacterium]